MAAALMGVLLPLDYATLAAHVSLYRNWSESYISWDKIWLLVVWKWWMSIPEYDLKLIWYINQNELSSLNNTLSCIVAFGEHKLTLMSRFKFKVYNYCFVCRRAHSWHCSNYVYIILLKCIAGYSTTWIQITQVYH